MIYPDSLMENITERANTRALAAANAGKDIVQDDARDGFLSAQDATDLLVAAGVSFDEYDIEAVQAFFSAAWDAAVEAELEAIYL